MSNKKKIIFFIGLAALFSPLMKATDKPPQFLMVCFRTPIDATKKLLDDMDTQLLELEAQFNEFKRKFVGSAAKAFQEIVVENIAADFSSSRVVMKTLDSEGKEISVTMDLEKRLGGGVFGNVYVVGAIDHPELMGIDEDIDMVVKFPHSIKGLGKLGPPGVTKDAIRRETSSTDLIGRHLKDVESDAGFPKTAAWNKGSLPLVPITNMIETSSGPLIFKPLLKKAKFLGDIEELTPEMKAGLKDIYDLVQSIHGQIKMPDGKGLSIDIRPPNFAWVEDPEMLKITGLKRPGWVAFEMDQVADNIPHYIAKNGYTFENYVEEFSSYLKPKTP